jgi:hypothetical protein
MPNPLALRRANGPIRVLDYNFLGQIAAPTDADGHVAAPSHKQEFLGAGLTPVGPQGPVPEQFPFVSLDLHLYLVQWQKSTHVRLGGNRQTNPEAK